MAAVVASSSPARNSSRQWLRNTRATVTSVFTSASLKRVFWNSAMDLPNAFLSRVYSMVHPRAASMTATAPMATSRRSRGSWFIRQAKPRPSSPRMLEGGTRTSSQNSSAVSGSRAALVRAVGVVEVGGREVAGGRGERGARERGLGPPPNHPGVGGEAGPGPAVLFRHVGEEQARLAGLAPHLAAHLPLL